VSRQLPPYYRLPNRLLPLLLIITPLASPLVIDCDFSSIFWAYFNANIYVCTLKGDPSVTSPGLTVTAATGSHKPSMSHASVQGFIARTGPTLHFLPHGLSRIFPNLILVLVFDGRIKSVTQQDLKPFTKVRYLDLENNDLTVIEKDLLKFNTQLEVVRFNANRITRIHPTVFSHLGRLTFLVLLGNVCVDAYEGSRTSVAGLIAIVRARCFEDELWALEEKFVEIEEKVEVLGLKVDVKMTSELEAVEMGQEKMEAEQAVDREKIDSLERKVADLTAIVGELRLKMAKCEREP
jgi:hypothetical protein